MSPEPPRQAGLRDQLQFLRRRKWIVLAGLLVVPIAAIVGSLLQDRLYEASAQVLLSRQSPSTAVLETQGIPRGPDFSQFAQTQADLARAPELVQDVLDAADLENQSVNGLLGRSAVTTSESSDLLTFAVTDGDRDRARLLATEYARQFILYKRDLDVTPIRMAREGLEARIAEERESPGGRGGRDPALIESLEGTIQELRTLEALQVANASLIQLGDVPRLVQPRLLQNALFGLIIGLVLGVGAAYLRELLDTRVRSADEVIAALNLPLMVRLGAPPEQLRESNRLSMLHEPSGVYSESIRQLRNNLDFVNLEDSARTIVMTSAVEGEGKSTTVANLAVALARGGRRVILIDLDLRRPHLDRLFNLSDRPGLTQVVLGHVELDAAMSEVSIPNLRAIGSGSAVENGAGDAHGSLRVLTAGPIPPDVGEFVGSRSVARVLKQSAERAEIVLIDAPPLLPVGDVMAMGPSVDAMLIVTRLNLVRRPMLRELRRLLGASSIRPLGVIVADAEQESSGYYGSYGVYFRSTGYAPRPEQPAGSGAGAADARKAQGATP